MLAFITALGFRTYQTNFAINVAHVMEDPYQNNYTTIHALLAHYTEVGPVNVFELPILREDNITSLTTAIGTDNLYVFPAEDISPDHYNSNLTIQTVATMEALTEAVGQLSADAVYIVGQPEIIDIHKDYTNYWVPAVWNSFIAIVIFIALTACSITYFAKISVQTKFAKRD